MVADPVAEVHGSRNGNPISKVDGLLSKPLVGRKYLVGRDLT